MTPIEYIDFMAHYMRMKASGYQDTPPPSELVYLADAMEKSAEFFRSQDSALPPPKRYPNPESYYAK